MGLPFFAKWADFKRAYFSPKGKAIGLLFAKWADFKRAYFSQKGKALGLLFCKMG